MADLVSKRISKTRYITVTAILAAVASVLMFFSFNIPLVPSFIKMDFSELPALIGAFALGPWCGVLVCLLKNIVNVFFTTTGGIGEVCNFLLGASFVIPAGFIYKFKKNKLGALIAAMIGSLVMAVLGIFINYYISYPVYMKFLPLETIISMYQAIYSGIENLWQALIVFNMPFTLFKGLANCVITFIIYKKLSVLLKGY